MNSSYFVSLSKDMFVLYILFCIYFSFSATTATESAISLSLPGCKNCTEYGLETLKKCTLDDDTQCGPCLKGYYNWGHKGIKSEYPSDCAKCEPGVEDEACKNMTGHVESANKWLITTLGNSIWHVVVLICVLGLLYACYKKRRIVCKLCKCKKKRKKTEETPDPENDDDEEITII